MYKVIKQEFEVEFKYNIYFTENIFDINNKLLVNTINVFENRKSKVIVFIDKNVTKFHKHLNQNIINYFNFFNDRLILVSEPILISSGERLKNRFLYLKKFYKLIEKYKICRQSYVLSIGGGSLQDFIGYITSTAHRGVRLIRLPTTVLSQDDSGVGVKNGINYIKKKNFIGCFTVPYAVINDYHFLSSLDNDKFIEGFSEAIKVALIKDSYLFDFIEKHSIKLKNRNIYIVKHIIYNCAKLHAEHISQSGDPFETLSSRPLDFGHWIAHKIESLSNYRIAHGKAVAIGILIDCTYSYFLGFLSRFEWKRIVNVFMKLGFDIYVDELNVKGCNIREIFNGLEEFREHLGGKLTITLIKNIGKKFDIHHINKNFYIKAIMFLKKLDGTYHNVYKK